MNKTAFFLLCKRMGLTVILLALINLYGCGPGSVKSISDAELVDQKICFLDEYYTGKRNPKKTYNLYVVDANSGELLKSEKIGFDAKLLISDGVKLLIQVAGKYLIYNTAALSTELTIDHEYLSAVFPELAEGVTKTEFLYKRIYIHTKSGLVYQLDPFTSEIELKSNAKPFDIVYYSCDNTKAYIFDNGFEKPLFSIKPKMKGESRLYICRALGNGMSDPYYSEDYFLEGNFVSIFADEQMLIVKGYTTTDREAQQLACLNFDLKTIWKITSTDLGISEKNVDFVYCFKNTSGLYVNIGTHWIGLDSASGEVLWKKKF